MSNPLKQSSDAGVAMWLDELPRERLVSGSLATLTCDCHVVGVTNPTIPEPAISDSALFDVQVKDLAIRAIGADEARRAVIAWDGREARDVLRPVYAASDGVVGRVAIEVAPRFACDTQSPVAGTRAVVAGLPPESVHRSPATPAGVPAFERMLADGVGVNVTLGFASQRYGDMIDARTRGR